MRAVVKAQPGVGAEMRSDVIDRPLRRGEVRIEVRAASVCGTDISVFRDSEASRALGRQLPVTLGHECAGVVVESAHASGRLAIGDRVAVETHIACFECFQCRMGNAHNCVEMVLLGIQMDGGFAERLVVPASTCFPLPDEISFQAAALLEPAGSAMHAVQRAGLDLKGARVAVTGAGPIGIVLTEIALALGAETVLVVEPHDGRRRRAVEAGAAVAHPDDGIRERSAELTADRGGFDVAFECSGVLSAATVLLDVVRPESTVVSVGLTSRPMEIDATGLLIKKGVTLKGSFGRQLWDSWHQLSTLVAENQVNLERLITHRLPLESFEEAFDLVGGDSCKVILDPTLRGEVQQQGRDVG